MFQGIEMSEIFCQSVLEDIVDFAASRGVKILKIGVTPRQFETYLNLWRSPERVIIAPVKAIPGSKLTEINTLRFNEGTATVEIIPLEEE
jgi:hypothetical protein